MPSQEEKLLSESMASLAHSLAGGISGMLSLSILYPLETIKYRQQASSTQNSVTRGQDDSCGSAELGKRWSDLLNPEFYKTAYGGMWISLVETGCFHGTHFYVYTLLTKRWLRLNSKATTTTNTPPVVSLVNGIVAGLIVQLTTSPLKVLQVKSVLNKDKSVLELAQGVCKKSGLGGFWSGFGLNTILVLNPAITFLVYERARDAARRMGFVSPAVDFCCGFIAKCVATVVTYPCMVAKTRILAGESGGMLMILNKMIKSEGFRGCFKGLGAKMTQTTLTNAFVFMFKEQIVKLTIKVLVLLLVGSKRRAVARLATDV